MAGETLKTAAELLRDFPDNQAGLIEPVHVRSVIVSVSAAVGFVEDDPLSVPYTIPMTDGVPVDFMSTLVGPLFAGNYWKLDANNALIPSYTDFGITVPAGTQRLNTGSVILALEKVGGGTGSYQFQGTEGGQLTGEPFVREISAVPSVIVFSGSRLYDVSLGNPISFNITPIGTSDDLQINDVRVTLEAAML
jgi:hypothetical protein